MLSVNRADVLAMQQWFRIQVRSSFGVRDRANCDVESTQIIPERIQNESESRCSQCIHLFSACGEANGMLIVNRADVLAVRQRFRIHALDCICVMPHALRIAETDPETSMRQS